MSWGQLTKVKTAVDDYEQDPEVTLTEGELKTQHDHTRKTQKRQT